MKKISRAFVSAIIVAAGKGSRMNMNLNKVFIEICGKPVLARTLEVFEDCSLVDEIILVVNKEDIVYCKQDILDAYDIQKVKTIVAGGEERQQSVYNGLAEVSENCDIVLVHDGARPFIRNEQIVSSIHDAWKFGASCVAVPSKDTLKIAEQGEFVKETLDRSAVWSVQTPQTFKYELLMEAHEKAYKDNFMGTDDAVLVERLGWKIKLTMGSYENIKITTKEDLIFAEAITLNRMGRVRKC